MIGKLAFLWKCFTNPTVMFQQSPHRQGKLLSWTLLFVILFCTATLSVVLIFNPHNDPSNNQYGLLIGGLVIFLIFAYILNCTNHYLASAILLVTSTAVVPWASLSFDHSILQGDIIPLTYVTFSVLLSSIFLPIYITSILALLQLAGIILVLLISPTDASLNWFSFLAFVFVTSMFGLMANSIIQRDFKKITDQAHQLALNEALLKEQVIRDDLTGLYNRRYLNEMFEREIQRTLRKQVPLCIVALDVDRFKHINDTLGHAAGDSVLRELGNFLSKKVRQSDIACRYGGDEFILVLPETSRETTIERVEQLQKGIKGFDLQTTITISAGIASVPENGTDGETLLKSADSALYQAKREGYNRVVVAN